MNVQRFRIGQFYKELDLSKVESKGGRAITQMVAPNRERVQVLDSQGRETIRLEFADGKCVRRETRQYEKNGSVLIVAQEDSNLDGKIDIRSRIAKDNTGRATSIYSEVRVKGSDRFEPTQIRHY